MRIIYLTLGAFILFNIGAACRTAPVQIDGCNGLGAGLVHCARNVVSDD